MKIFKIKNKSIILLFVFLVTSFYFVRNTNANDLDSSAAEENVFPENTDENPSENLENSEEPPLATLTEESLPEEQLLAQSQTETLIPEATQTIPPQAPETTETLIPIQETVIEEIFVESEEEEIEYVYVPPVNLPKISVKNKEVVVKIDPEAKHSCSIEGFKADLTNVPSLEKKIFLNNSTSSNKDVEILGLPKGFNIKFTKNSQSKLSIGNETFTNIKIEKTSTAQKGSFNISFVFTQKGSKNSSVICQMNLINR